MMQSQALATLVIIRQEALATHDIAEAQVLGDNRRGFLKTNFVEALSGGVRRDPGAGGPASVSLARARRVPISGTPHCPNHPPDPRGRT